jgi:hypothetical protein
MYYESHITVEPVFDERLERFTELCASHGFKPAKLMMQKRQIDTPERSQYDSFCTGRGQTENELTDRMYGLVHDLQDAGFAVWRYKIEHVVLDCKLSKVVKM